MDSCNFLRSALILLLLVWHSATAAPKMPFDPETDLARVASFTELPPTQRRSFHVLVQPHPNFAAGVGDEWVEELLTSSLVDRGYVYESSMLDADLVVVARLSAVAAERSRTEREQSRARLSFRVEAYDLPAYTEFLVDAGDHAAEWASLEFMVWETAVETRADPDHGDELVPRLGLIASRYLDSNSEGQLTLELLTGIEAGKSDARSGVN